MNLRTWNSAPTQIQEAWDTMGMIPVPLKTTKLVSFAPAYYSKIKPEYLLSRIADRIDSIRKTSVESAKLIADVCVKFCDDVPDVEEDVIPMLGTLLGVMERAVTDTNALQQELSPNIEGKSECDKSTFGVSAHVSNSFIEIADTLVELS